jgi:aldehyde dehydrogenase (NAD+)
LGVIAIVCGSNPNENCPLLKFILHLVAAIAYGNTVIIVPDSKAPLPALDLYEIFDTSDMPGGVVNILTGDKQHLTKYLCEHQQINAVWYMNDFENKALSANELSAQRFIRYTSGFSLKQSWLINGLVFDKNGNFLSRSYLNELKWRSVQSKYISVPMGTIFAN